MTNNAMKENFEMTTLISQFQDFVKDPVNFLSVQDDLKDDVKLFLKSMYDYTKRQETEWNLREFPEKCTSLSELIVLDFEEEQIWQELELQNEESWQFYLSKISTYIKMEHAIKFPITEIKNNVKVESPVVRAEYTTNVQHDDSKNSKAGQRQRRVAKSSIVDDNFFKLKDMEQFLIKEDKKANLLAGATDSEDESIDYFADSDEESSDQLGKAGKLKYNDFFGDDDCEVSDLGEDNSTNEKKKVRFNTEETINSADSENFTNDNINEESMEQKYTSDFSSRQKRLQQQISELEDKKLAEKPWQLNGEIYASNRPQNSLLQEVVDFDLTSRPAPLITEETTFRLEDIIKERIKDKLWDDVERKSKPTENLLSFRKNVILDQEKSKMSLAQIYEQEYLKQKKDGVRDNVAQEEEPENHKQIKSAITKLFAKLDALCNYHYTPKLPIPEIKIISNVPAITMEEIAPVVTSDAALLAPEEIKGKRKGSLISKAERSATDKQRERRKKKQMQKHKFQNKEIQEKSMNGSKQNSVFKENMKKSDMSKKMEHKITVKTSKDFFTKLAEDRSSLIVPNQKNFHAKKHKS